MAVSKIEIPHTRTTRLNSIVNISTGTITLSTPFDTESQWLCVEGSAGSTYDVGVVPSYYVRASRTLNIPMGEGYVTLTINGIDANDTVEVTRNTSGINVRYLVQLS